VSRERKLKNYLLNRPFQLKYTAMVVGLSSLLSVGLGFFVVQQSRENSRMLRLEAQMDPAFQELLYDSDLRFMVGLVLSLLVFNGALFIGSILMTHRMAGPVFVLGRYVRMVAEGKLPLMRNLRRSDEFHDLHASVQQMVHTLETQAKADIAVLEEALAALPDDAPAREEVARALEEKRERVARALTPTEDMMASGSTSS
jgi:methyl-accepting chemotaxis protein